MLAAVGDTSYNIVLILHVLTAVAAFVPAIAHPLLASQSRALDPGSRGALMGYLVANGRRLYAPALIVSGLAGFALAGFSDQVFELSQGWLLAAVIVWIAMNGVLHAVIISGERAVAGGDESGARRIDIGGIALSLLLVVMLYLMVFKPGL